MNELMLILGFSGLESEQILLLVGLASHSFISGFLQGTQ